MAKLIALCDRIVPDGVAEVLETVGRRTGLSWGAMPAAEYWFQPPKLHFALFVVAMMFCATLQRQSRGFRAAAVARLYAAGKGRRSLQGLFNKVVAYFLVVCLMAQIVAKASRPKPLVQLGWLLMPCHIFSAIWACIFLLYDKPHHYGHGCYLASLLLDWAWGPVGALMQPDWGDHQYTWEGRLFAWQHQLLAVLPLYFATRYDTLGLDWAHLCHLTWMPTFVNFAVFVPCGLLLGLNVNYQLAPPQLGRSAPAALRSAAYRPFFVLCFIALSIVFNLTLRFLGRLLRACCRSVKKMAQLG